MDRPETVHSYPIARRSRPFRSAVGGADDARSVVFSPDSRRFAVVVRAPGYRDESAIVIVNEGTGEHWVLHEGEHYIQDLAWLSDDELVYCVISNAGYVDEVPKTLWIYRHRVDEGDDNRKEVFCEPVSVKGGSLGVRWSPSGRYVIVRENEKKQAALVDVMSGTVTRFGPNASSRAMVSWKPNSSTALVVIEQRRGGEDTYTAFLVKPSANEGGEATVEEVSLPDGLNWAWRTICSRWTADGAYVVSEYGMMLIRPDPWTLVDLTDRVRALSMDEGESRSWGYHVVPLPVPGWLAVYGSREGRVVAVDYEMTHVVKLADSDDWALSPDGAWVVEIDKSGNPGFHSVDLQPPSED